MRFTGPKNSRWRGGSHLSDKMYRRLSAHPNRNKYEHRWVMEQLLLNPISYIYTPGQGIPSNMTVEHVDHRRTHNCCGNLMLLEKCIHDRISRWHQTYLMRNYDAFIEHVQEENRWE